MVRDGEILSDASVLAANRIYETQGSQTFTFATPEDIIYLPEDGSAVNFVAYYPYRKTLTSYLYPVDVSDQSSQEAIDLLYSHNTNPYTKADKSVPFSFSHQLVKLVLNLKPAADDESLQGITVRIQGMKTEAAFDLTTGQLSIKEDSGKDIVFKTLTHTNGSVLAEAILLPAAPLSGVKIVFTLPSGATTTWAFTDEMFFDAGNRYTYDVILKGTQVEPTPNYGWFETPVITSQENTYYKEYFLPEPEKNHIRNYSLLYDSQERLAYWVAYPLHSSYIGSSGRTNKWQYDPTLPEEWQPDLSSSYPDTNLDRGHQLPSADRTYSAAGNYTTFYYSNMTAQNATLNRYTWANLEEKIRKTWMVNCDTLYVVTGAMITTTTDKQVEYTKDKAGKDIAKPKYYYKVLAQKRGEQYYTIGFKMNNEPIASTTNFIPYQLTVSELEAETGFTFFPALSNEVKSSIDTSVW